MRIAVTGSSGRVGQAVVTAALEAGHDLVLLDRRPVEGGAAGEFREVDLTQYAAVCEALAGCEVLVHLGGIPGPDQTDDVQVHDNNVLASYHALAGAVANRIPRVVQASSINAVGATWSRAPHFDHFPVDVGHPTRNEDGYSLSKWVAEQQADSLTRRHADLSVASLRFHSFVPDRETARRGAREQGEAWAARGLWGYTTAAMLTSACLAACRTDFTGHERLQVVAADTSVEEPSEVLRQRWYPDVPVRRPFVGREGFWDCSRTVELLGWHPEPQEEKA